MSAFTFSVVPLPMVIMAITAEDPDDDAEQRQEGAQHVAAHRDQGEADRFEKH